ncbi:hypothetical protein ONZ45_g1241 [Pleurotus djamor]|nr:hypothetical protein ONZ45_g1241 [Pleurotus djamor]
MEALKGTNLHSATIDRQNCMQTDWLQCQSAFQSVEPDLAAKLTWDHYLSASTYLASRAFPSSILSATPTLIASPTSYPVLLPGIDSLNHARGQPVTWLVSYPNNSGDGDLHVQKSPDPTISLVLHTSAETGDELFNNYGPKPNSELILAYGFTLPQNPDDTIVLKIGGHGDKWEVGRDARGFEVVWDQVLSIMVQQSHQDDEEFDGDASFEDELDAADTLSEMLGTLLDRLPNNDNVRSEKIRPEVAEMIQHYVEGQRSILESTIEFTENKKRKAIEKAREQGVELVFDDEEE